MDAFLTQSITLERRAGTFDVYGQPSVAAPATLSSRVQQRTKMVRGAQGEQVLSDAQVFLNGGTTIAPGDMVTYGGQRFEVLAVERGQGLDSETHVVAYLGGR